MQTATLLAARFGLDLVVKVTFLFAVVLLSMASLRRVSAARRHLLAMLGLTGALAIPFLSAAVPSVRLGIFPSVFATASVTPPADPGVVRAARVGRVDPLGAISTVSADDERLAGLDGAVAPGKTPDLRVSPVRGPVAAPGSSERISLPIRLSSFALGPMGWVRISLALWLAGSLFFLARLALGLRRVREIARLGTPLRDREWIEMVEGLRGQLGLRRAVRLLGDSRVGVAMTAGVRRPVVVLHEGARKWPEERRRVVILHELAHVRRSDWIALLAAEVAVAVYWFHPLAWIARNQARASCEQACDDLVLEGTKPSVYAAHLLGIVRSLKSAGAAALPIMSMARPSQFEDRMRAILDSSLPRRGPSLAEKRGMVLGAFSVAACLAVVQPWSDCAARGQTQVQARPAGSPHELVLASAGPDAAGDEDTAAAKTGQAKRCPAMKAEAPEAAIVPAVQRSDKVETSPWAGFVLASNSHGRSGSDWYSRGMDLHNDERYDESIAAFAKAIELDYRVPAATYNIACGYALKGNKDQAFTWLARAKEAGFPLDSYLRDDDDLDHLRSDPRFAALRREARNQKADEDRDEARETARRLERLTSSGAKNGATFYEIGKKLLGEEGYADAAKAFQKSADLGYRVGASTYNKACALSLAGEKGPALEALLKSIENGFDDVSLLKSDDDLDAIRAEAKFRDIQSLARDLEMPSIGLDGFFGNHRAAWRDAARQAQRAAEKYPQMGRAWFNLGYVQIRADRPEAAAEAFQKALDLKYRTPTTLYNLACSFAKLDRKDQAFDFLFRALDAGFDGESMMRDDEDLDGIRHDARFRKALKIAQDRSEKDSD